MKKGGLILLLTGFSLCFFLPGYAQTGNEVRLLTYYPAPYGVYRNLEVRRAAVVSASPIMLFSLWYDFGSLTDSNLGFGISFIADDDDDANRPNPWIMAGINAYRPDVGMAGGLAFYTNDGNNTDADQAMIISENGYIGIASANPAAPLDIRKNVNAGGGTALGINISQTLTATADNDNLTAVRIAPAFQNISYSGVTENALIVEAGNVGIGGTPNPEQQLFVNGNANIGANHSEFLQIGNNFYVASANRTTQINPALYFFSLGRIRYGMKLHVLNGQYGLMLFGPQQASGNRFISFNQITAPGNLDGEDDFDGGERMRIDLNSGNVGIGTDAPATRLHVQALHTNNNSSEMDIATFGRSFHPEVSTTSGQTYNINFQDENSNGTQETFSRIRATAMILGPGTEKGRLSFSVANNRDQKDVVNIDPGNVIVNQADLTVQSGSIVLDIDRCIYFGRPDDPGTLRLRRVGTYIIVEEFNGNNWIYTGGSLPPGYTP